jgi:cytoskeletal protein RodZ
MPEVGPELKLAREALGLSLEQIATRTHINKKYLRALEEGEYSVFPGVVYLRGALRKYAGEVGIDPEQALSWHQAGNGMKDLTPAPAQTAFGKEVKAPRVKIPGLKLLAVLAVVAALLGAGHLACRALLPRLTSPPAQVTEPVLPPEPDGEEGAKEPAPPEPAPEVVTVEREITPDGIRFRVSGAGELEALISFAGRCWISLAADGVVVREETFNAGDGFIVSAGSKIRLRAGYPPALNITVAGQKLELPATGNPYNVEIVLTGN